MIKIDDFSKMMEWEAGLVNQQTADLSHEDSLIQPQPAGNCLNWIMGHLVVNLVEILEFLGGSLPDDIPDLKRYRIHSEPIRCDAEDVIKLEVLIETYNHLTGIIQNRLAKMTEADFEEEIEFWQGKKSRGYVVFFYFFHNTYHLGQLEQLRNLAGKTDKVI